MNGLRLSEALGADVNDSDTECGHRTLRNRREGGWHVTIPLAPHSVHGQLPTSRGVQPA